MVHSKLSRWVLACAMSLFAAIASANESGLDTAFATGKPVLSSDGELVGVLRSSPRLRGEKIRLFVKGSAGSTFSRYHVDTIIDMPLASLQITGANLVLPETELYLRQSAYIPTRDDGTDPGAIRLHLK